MFPSVLLVLASCFLLTLSGCKGDHSASADAELARAKQLIASGNFNEAFRQLNRALAEAPRDPQVHLNLGWLYLYTDDPANAERELKSAANLAPDLADTYKLRGDLLSYQGQHEKSPEAAKRLQALAVENYEKALQRDGKNYQTYFDLANSFTALDRDADALDKLNEGFDFIPKQDLETQVNFQVATCSAEIKLKLYDEAIADCQQAYKFTNSPASKERIEELVENMKLMNPSASVPALEGASTEGNAQVKEAEEKAILEETSAE